MKVSLRPCVGVWVELPPPSKGALSASHGQFEVKSDSGVPSVLK